MSWLYTVVFAALMASSQGNSVSNFSTERGIQGVPAAETSRKGDETEKFEQTYPLNADGRVSVSNVNGSITVEAWDRNEVKLEFTKIADTKERLAEVEIRIESKPDHFSVETDYDNWKTKNHSDRWRNGGKLTVEFHLMAPRGAVLDEVETVNGSVTVSNFVNFTKVSAVNGSVNASNLRGAANLETVNGEVLADFDRLEQRSKISLETVNGKVSLTIPSDSNATVRADSLNGNITNDFGLPVRKGKYVGRDLYGRLGSGEVQIKLESVNGGLSINRKNDGKSLSPSTNLLPQKGKDDEDWDKDFEDDLSVKSVKMDKEVLKTVKESSKIAAKAVADAQTEIAKIQPELGRIKVESATVAAEAANSDELKEKINEAAILRKGAFSAMVDAGFATSIPRIEKKSGTFRVKGIPKVTVYAEPCSVKVVGWDKSEVQYRVIQYIEPRRAEPLKVSEEHTDSTVSITVDEPRDNNGLRFYGDGQRTMIEVFVPRRSNLKITANGELRVEGVTGDVELTGTDGAINVRDVDGKLRASNSDGRIRVIGFRGEVDAETSDGAINLEGDFQKLTVHASDGSVTLTLPENASADLETSCDEILGEGIFLKRISGDDDHTNYRIGNGGAVFRIETGGQIRVRGASGLKDGY
jgi:hypothetical protein